MKFKLKKTPDNRETKINKGFLFLPKWIGLEIRWLEFAKWKSEYRARCLSTPSKWIDTDWIDND